MCIRTVNQELCNKLTLIKTGCLSVTVIVSAVTSIVTNIIALEIQKKFKKKV